MHLFAHSAIGFVAALAAAGVVAQPSLTATCNFDRAMKFDQEANRAFPETRINQSMRVERSRTTEATLALDGALRATNSRRWTAFDNRDFETWQSRFAADFGEVLTVEHQLGSNRSGLRGSYRASLVTPGVGSTLVQLGQCRID
jgi:hypothetical protein